MAGGFFEHFSIVRDPRLDRNKKHNLIDIIVLCTCGIISGCDGFVDIENYAKSKHEWFKNFLQLPEGIPSHDTLGRVISLLNPQEMQKAFYNWTKSLIEINKEIINIDGKYVSSSHGSTGKNQSIFGMVNAWASEAGIALSQLRTDYEKKNEKEAMEDLLKLLELEGSTVTVDAGGTYASIENIIVEKKADYVMALKTNQAILYDKVEKLSKQKKRLGLDEYEVSESGHGRKETRIIVAGELPKDFLEEYNDLRSKNRTKPWLNLKTFFRISSTRTIKGKKTKENRYYLSSLPVDAKKMLKIARAHWHIENKLHWSLDVSFNEDSCRVRNGFAGENLSLIRQLGLNLLKKETSKKASLKTKRLTCGWDNDYLIKVLEGMEF